MGLTFKKIIENKWWQEVFILVFSFILFTLNDWILIKSWRGVSSGAVYFLMLYGHAQLNRYLLLPILFKKHKVLLYILATVVLAAVFSLILHKVANFWIYKNCFLYKSAEQKSYVFQAATLVASLICILSTILIFKFYRDRKNLDQEKLLYNQAQINSLKEQLNPHFLFNTFNTLYGISLQFPDRTPELIMHVSQLMRYQLESNERKCVPVEDEINFIASYVQLEKERVGYRCNIEMMTDVDDEGAYKIPPMLLICFIENAFKHGTCSIEKCFVYIGITIKDGKLDLLVKNSVPEKKTEVVSTKIGIKNTIERLKLQYGSDYSLDITENATYTVHLQLQLKRI
ncbi:histidine kinase [Flavobacterium akiainvivens]|uniref:Histidine kinase n=1 Tax=Flavobacterium akiainvivens TaxID=1202724 RepID=A0A0M9VHK7_9FLAO|nr:histidine kinase [Flavobacterium akiainvivens]KOS05679.1 histidine kinase [Flavobacterium akiainvivens]SFQ36551.1 Histidine kinase [Flavobacterium akiainvivens]